MAQSFRKVEAPAHQGSHSVAFGQGLSPYTVLTFCVYHRAIITGGPRFECILSIICTSLFQLCSASLCNAWAAHWARVQLSVQLLSLTAPSAGVGASLNKGLSSQRSNACLIGLFREDALEVLCRVVLTHALQTLLNWAPYSPPTIAEGPSQHLGASGENCTEVDQSRSLKSGEVRTFNVGQHPWLIRWRHQTSPSSPQS